MKLRGFRVADTLSPRTGAWSRWGLLIVALIAPVGVAAGFAFVAWGHHTTRGTDGFVSLSSSHSTPPPTSAPVATNPSPATTLPVTTTGPVTPPTNKVSFPLSAPTTPRLPSPPPPHEPGGPSVAVSQAADCIQDGDTNQVVASAQAPAGLQGVALTVVHATDGTTYTGPMGGDGTTYRAALGPFAQYPDPQTVTWTVTVTDTRGRTAEVAKQFTVSTDPCP